MEKVSQGVSDGVKIKAWKIITPLMLHPLTFRQFYFNILKTKKEKEGKKMYPKKLIFLKIETIFCNFDKIVIYTHSFELLNNLAINFEVRIYYV